MCCFIFVSTCLGHAVFKTQVPESWRKTNFFSFEVELYDEQGQPVTIKGFKEGRTGGYTDVGS